MTKLTKNQFEALANAVKATTGFKMGVDTNGVQHVEAGNIVSRSGRKWKTCVAFTNNGGKLQADISFTENATTSYSSENLSGEKLRDFIKYRGRRLCLKGADIQRILGFFNSIVPTVEEKPATKKVTKAASKPKAPKAPKAPKVEEKTEEAEVA